MGEHRLPAMLHAPHPMPITHDDLRELTKVLLDDYLLNIRIDQIGVERPLLKRCLAKRKLFFGARQHIVENVRKDYGSHFMWAYGETPVEFNKRNMTEQVQFPWRRAVDGLYLAYDRLFGAGIDVRKGARGEYRLAQNERMQLLNLLDEQMESLKLGFLDRLDTELHRDGTASLDAITGLDALVSTNPSTSMVGGINQEKMPWWRNAAYIAIKTGHAGNLTLQMEQAWRRCIRNGGVPDFILAGSAFLDTYSSRNTSRAKCTGCTA